MHRIESLEREIAELRADNREKSAEIERLKAQKDAPRPVKARRAPSSGEEGERTSRSNIGRIALSILGIAALAGAIIVLPEACAARRAMTAPGRVADLHLVDIGDGGPLLLALRRIELETEDSTFLFTRIELIAPRTGDVFEAQLLEKRDDWPDSRSSVRVQPAGLGRFWLKYSEGETTGLELWTTSPLAPLHDMAALAATNPALKSGLHGPVYVDDRGRALVTTRSGDELMLSPESARAEPRDSEGHPSRHGSSMDDSPPTTTSAASALFFSSAGAGSKVVLATRASRHGDDAPLPEAEPVLSASFLADGRDGIRRTPGGGPLFLHATRLGSAGEDNPWLLSAATPTGKPLWTHTLAGRSFVTSLAADLGTLVVVMNHGGGNRITAIDLQTGRSLWSNP